MLGSRGRRKRVQVEVASGDVPPVGILSGISLDAAGREFVAEGVPLHSVQYVALMIGPTSTKLVARGGKVVTLNPGDSVDFRLNNDETISLIVVVPKREDK